jgi:hypothetical protein
MKMIDLTDEASKVFEPNLTMDKLFVKMNIEVHTQRIEQMDKALNEILKVYDNPIQVKTIITTMLSENSKDLINRGVVEPFKLELV